MRTRGGAPPDAAALRDAGVDDAEIRPDVLLPLAGRTEALDRALVARLASAPGAEQAAALRALATGAEARGWKAVAKDVRRALYRFEQRGVALPPPPPPAPAPRRAAAAELEGYLSPIDGRGDRLVWLVRPRREGGLAVMTAILNEPAGLREVTVAEMPRKTLRRMRQDLEQRHGLRMVAADARYCDALLAEGFARGRAAGTSGIGEYPTARAGFVGGAPAPLEPALAARVLGDAPVPESERPAEVAALLEQPELVTWVLERAVLAPYLEAMEDARNSPLVLSQAQQEERVRAILARAPREIFDDAAAAAMRRRLEEMAYYFHATGRPELATAAATSAAAVPRARAEGGAALLLEELTRRSLAARAAEDAARAHADQEGSVLVRPTPPGRRPTR